MPGACPAARAKTATAAAKRLAGWRMRRDTPSNAVGAHLGATCDRSRPSALLRPAIGRARVRSYQGSCMSRIQRILAWGLFTPVLLVLRGWLLAAHLTPRSFGVPSPALPLQGGRPAPHPPT